MVQKILVQQKNHGFTKEDVFSVIMTNIFLVEEKVADNIHGKF